MSIVVVVCIYVFDQNSFERTKQCLKSLEILKEKIIVKGWVNEDFKFPYKLEPTNTGKSKIINTLIPEIKEDFIFYLDGDILIPQEDNFLFRLKQHYKHTCVLLPNQKEDIRHNLNILEQEEEKYTSTSPWGFAGGCFFTETSLLREIPFPEVGEYGPDDVLWFEKIYKQGYTAYILKNIFITHPYDKDKDYKKKKEIISLNWWKTNHT